MAKYLLAVLLVLSQSAAAQEEILFGTTTALTGPSKFLGLSMVRGIEAHFAEVNRAGGIDGRQVRLWKLDDAYHPPSAAANMQRLVADPNLLAVVGNVGTPTAKEVVPLANQHKVLLFGAFSGASLLRQQPPQRYVINFRPSYDQETSLIVDTLLKRGVSANEIAFFTQDDPYGEAGYQGVLKALQQAGFQGGEALPRGRYTRSTLNVEQGLLRILRSEVSPKAIIIIGTYRPAAKFIRMAREVFPGAEFYTVSFMGPSAFAGVLREQLIEDSSLDKQKPENVGGLPIYLTQVVPPLSSQLAGVLEYQQAMAAFAPEAALDEVSLEGYLVAKLLLAGVRRAGDYLDRESLIDALEGIHHLDIGSGAPLSFSKTRHQASDWVWMSRFDGEHFVPLQEKQGEQ